MNYLNTLQNGCLYDFPLSIFSFSFKPHINLDSTDVSLIIIFKTQRKLSLTNFIDKLLNNSIYKIASIKADISVNEKLIF